MDPMPHPSDDTAAPDIAVVQAYVQRLLDITGRDATKLARLAKLSPSTLTRLMSDQPRGSLRRSTLETLARVTGIPVPPELGAEPPALDAVAAVAHRHDVPLHGLVGTRFAGLFYWNQTVIDFACRPPGVAHAARVFALRMPDDSMDGWRRVDEMVFVDPTRSVAEGDYAFVELANQAAPDDHSVYAIRRVLRRRPDGVVLQRWGHEPVEERLPRAEVLAFHKVIEWPELLGC